MPPDPSSNQPSQTNSRDIAPREVPQLQFLTISNPQDMKTKEARRLVRSRAMLDYISKERKRANNPDADVVFKPKLPEEQPEPRRCSVCVHSRYHRGKVMRDCQLCKDISRCRAPSRICTCRATSGPLSLLGAGRVDPFDSFCTPVSVEGQKLLDHFVHVVSPLHVGHLGEVYAKGMAVEYASAGMVEPAALAAMFLLSARSFQSLFQVDVYDAARFRGLLIRRLNEAMHDATRATSDAAIASLCILKYDEFFLRDYAAYKVHSKALQCIVQQRGGPYNLGMHGIARDTVLNQDIGNAYIIGEPLYYQHALNSRKTSFISFLPYGFQATPAFQNISQDLLGILDDLARMAKLIQSSDDRQLPSTADSNELVLNALQSDILVLADQSPRLNPHLEYPEVEKCVSLTAELFLERIVRGMPASDFRNSWIIGEVLRLVSSLSFSTWCTGEDENNALELLLWAVFVCGFTITRPVQMDLWTRTADVVLEELDIQTWAGAKHILRRFLWVEQTCDDFGSELWVLLERVWDGTWVVDNWKYVERAESSGELKNFGYAVWNSLQKLDDV